MSRLIKNDLKSYYITTLRLGYLNGKKKDLVQNRELLQGVSMVVVISI